MPKRPTHTLVWSSENNAYRLHVPEQQPQLLMAEDEDSWFTWLATHSSFSFQGRSGRLSVLKEARSRGEGYWYAYHTAARRTHKHYLGRTPHVTFTRLEEVAQILSSKTASATLPPEFPQDYSEHKPMLLLTKLSHPRLPSSLVAREHLLTRLGATPLHRLMLLSASAGWGKTTLLSAWATHASFPIAWLSLDELDNDPIRFWVSVLAALRTRLPGIGEVALAMLHSPQPTPLTTALTTLLNDLSVLTEPIILLLDDYHLIDEQAIHDSLLFLLEHLPMHLHLVLASRVDPPLALSRLRARGQLLELRDADLRFLKEEAAAFLTHTMGLVLEDEEVTQLARRTEGWIAGLQLAALSLQQRVDHATLVQNFTGSHRYLLDYVQEEILERLPLPLQVFLLQTSLLSRLTASLCQAVTTEARSQEMLETIEHANLFLVPLDTERRWYRLHDLFREALLARLQATQPELVPLLHQRAAHWYEARGAWQEAITHALAGADFAYAVTLIEQTAEKFWLHGESQTLYLWIDALGSGLFLPFSLLYFTNVARLPLAAVGGVITISMLLSLPMTPLAGMLVDRVGARRVILISMALAALSCLGYLFVRTIPLLALTTLPGVIAGRLFWVALPTFIASISTEGKARDRWYGLVGVAQNAEIALGAHLQGSSSPSEVPLPIR